MTKREEEFNPESCFNKAEDDELVFVLLARDDATADTIRYWAKRRVELGKNLYTDAKIQTALAVARQIDAEHREKT